MTRVSSGKVGWKSAPVRAGSRADSSFLATLGCRNDIGIKKPTSGNFGRKWGTLSINSPSATLHPLVLCAFGGVQHTERVAAGGPNQDESILAFGNAGQCLLHIARGLDFVAIDLENDVSLLQSSVIGRTAGLDLLDHRTMNIVRSLKLIPHIGSQIRQADSPAHLALSFA